MTVPPAPRVTLMDVARRAGVSRTTASFVTTGRRDMRISADAQERVLRAARELNYRPSLLARSLRTNRSQTIGLLSDGIASDAFAGEMIRGSLTSALLHEHMLFIAETAGAAELEKRLIDNMLDRGVGGFLYASNAHRACSGLRRTTGAPAGVGELCGQGQDCTDGRSGRGGGRPGRGSGAASSRPRRRDRAGRRDPAHIVAGTERLSGVQQALAEQGLTLADSVETSWWPEPSYLAVAEFLTGGNRPSAFICLNDRIAMGVYQACQEAGLLVPHDISVVSFDDSDLARWLRPQLTSVAIPYFEMGRLAVEILLGPETARQVHRVPMTLRERGSVGPPAGQVAALRSRPKVAGR